MKYLLAAWMVLLASCSWSQTSSKTPLPPVIRQPKPAFIVFDSLSQNGKPDLTKLGMVAFPNSGHIWRPGVSRDNVDPRGVVSITTWLGTLGHTYYLDVEHWPLYGVPPDVLQANVQKLIHVAKIARDTTPKHPFGFYGLLPQRTYWPFVTKNQSEIDAWHEANRLSEPLAKHVDFVLPSLYTSYQDREGWKLAAREIMLEARRYKKPVYPFLWFEYHNTSNFAGKEIERDYWRMQLDFVRQYADGVVIWGGYKEPWDEKAAWWQETQDFIKTLQ
jgi:hypothetical protein